MIRRSAPTEASVLPSGEKVWQVTEFRCPCTSTSRRPLATSQTFVRRSAPPLASVRLPGEKATVAISPSWPEIACCCFPVATS